MARFVLKIKLFYLNPLILILFCLIFSPALAKNTGTIKGRVVDKQNGASLALVNVVLNNSKGTATDSKGIFSLVLAAGQYQLDFRHIGYHPEKMTIILRPDQTIDTLITLRPRVIPMPGVGITAIRSGEVLEKLLTPSAVTIDRRLVLAIPTAAEPDLFRTLQLLPSVSQTNELSSRIYVRGSNSDQNLVIIDDIELFNPFHLFGLSSAFNSDVIGSARMLPGAFSVRYGNRLGSVIDIRTRKPDSTFTCSGHASFTSISIGCSGRLGQKSGYLAAVRRNYYDQLKKVMTIDFSPYYYTDYNGKLYYEITPFHILSLSGFKSCDHLFRENTREQEIFLENATQPYPYHTIERYDLHWSNGGYSINYSGNFGASLTSKLVYSNSYASDYFEDSEQAIGIVAPAPPGYDSAVKAKNREYGPGNKLSQNRLGYDRFEGFISTRPASSLALTFGGKWARYRFDYQWHEFGFDDNGVLYMDYPPVNFNFNSRLTEKALFVETNWQPVQSMTSGFGVRANYWDKLKSWYLDPRFNCHFQVTKHLAMNFSAGQFSQAIATARESGLFTPLDLYFPTGIISCPERATHSVLEVEYSFAPIFHGSIAIYRKNFRDLLTRYRQGGGFAFESGAARGLEFKADFDLKWLNGYLSYTLSRSTREIAGFRYPTNFDQRHRVLAYANVDLGKNWMLDANWDFHTGQPYDPGVYHAVILVPGLNLETMAPEYFWTRTITVEVSRGSIRHPCYHRLDLGLTKKYYIKSWTIAPFFRILNAYWRKNVLYYDQLYLDYPGIPGPDSKPALLRRVNYLPTIPTLGVFINYN